jgi:hypothetical protein
MGIQVHFISESLMNPIRNCDSNSQILKKMQPKKVFLKSTPRSGDLMGLSLSIFQ